MTETTQQHTQRITPVATRLLRWLGAITLALWLALSAVQALYAVAHTQQHIEGDAQQLLTAMLPTTVQALQRTDMALAEQVLHTGLQVEAVRAVRLLQLDGDELNAQKRPLQVGAWRWLTDPIFGTERRFTRSVRAEQTGRIFGQLELTLDTANYAKQCVNDILFRGVSLALGLLLLLLSGYWIARRILTRPLAALLVNVERINPKQPAGTLLPPVSGHRQDELGLIRLRINQLLSAIEQDRQLKLEAEDKQLRFSQVDFLTSLPNRQGLQSKLERILDQASGQHNKVAVLCIGLDNFKEINERHSYEIGDWLLRAFSQRFTSQFSQEIQAFARLGGDQFIAVLGPLEHPYQAAVFAQKIIFNLQQQPYLFKVPYTQEQISIHLSATIGITLYPDDALSSESLLQKAEHTSQLAKLGARNRYHFYIASIDTELRLRRQMEADLKHAIAEGELSLVYQAQIDYRSRTLVGAEALLRWTSVQHGQVSPELFIPIAEQSGSIVAIGEWVLEQACRNLREWLDAGWDGFRLAVNLSTVQLNHKGLIPMVQRIIDTYRIPPGCLELEVTETGLMQNIELATRHLYALRQLGVGIAVDDFGTGHSSLSYLKSLPLDKIKIDRSFVEDVLAGEEDASIVRAIIQLSHSLDLTVLAEGVETLEQERFLVSLGCNEGQGYLYNRPVVADQLLQLMHDINR